MKLNQIALAVAALAAAPVAFALTPAQVNSSTVKLWLSGASAPTASVYKGVLTLCAGMQYKDALGVNHTNPGAIDAHLYVESSSAGKLPGSAGDRMAYTCTVDTDDDRAGSLENQKVVVFHTVEGGSFNYVTPHISIAGEGPAVGVNGNTVVYPIINNNVPGNLSRTPNIETLGATGKCADATVNKGDGVGNGEQVTIDLSGLNNDVNIYRGCGTFKQTFTPGQAKRASVTDAPDRPEGGFSDTEYLMNKLNLGVVTELSAIGGEVPTNIGQVFGAAVSYPLYAQLQKNQGIINTTAADGETCDANYAAGACQPNLPATLYTTVANAATIAGVTPAMFGVAAFPGTAGKLQFHRRAITSGTQSTANLRFLNKPCATGEAGGALEPSRSIANGGANYAGVIVTENSSTGGVKTGLTNATNAGEFGMGWVSMENIPVAGTDKWAFTKLDGIAPNTDAKQRQTAMDGSYSAFYELVAFTSAEAFLEGSELIAAVNTSLGNPGITDLPGLFITPLAGADPTALNVGKVYRNGNSCQPAAQ
jgi:hypothetical protein